MIIHYCDRCGRRLKQEEKSIFETITDVMAVFAESLKSKEPAFRFEICEKMPGNKEERKPAELCEKCEKDFETWFRGIIIPLMNENDRPERVEVSENEN